MKIHKLTAENFMKLNVEVEIDGHNVTITGQNEVGKSTFINSIWYALTGKDIPDEPIQQGKDSALIRVEVMRPDGVKLICTRNFKRDGASSLTVKTDEGASFTSPQAFLSTLIGEISFDPMEFISLQPAVQKKRLQKILGIDTTDLESTKKIKLAELDNYNKQIDGFNRELEQLPEFDTPIVERFITEVADKQKEITDAKKKVEDHNTHIRAHQDEQNNIIRTAPSITKAKEELQKKIASWEALILQAKHEFEKYDEVEVHDAKRLETLTELIQSLETSKKDIEVPEDTEIQKTVLEINENNEKFKQQTARNQKQLLLTQTIEKKATKAQEIQDLEDQRVKMIQGVKMPIAGLDFSDDGLTFNGLPFTPGQFSTGKQDEIGFAISIALKPNLRILRVKDWALFDSERKERVMKMASDNDYQLFIEQVTDDKSIGFIIQE